MSHITGTSAHARARVHFGAARLGCLRAGSGDAEQLADQQEPAEH